MVTSGSERFALLLRNWIKRGGNHNHPDEKSAVEELLQQPSMKHLLRLVEKGRFPEVIRIFKTEEDAVIAKWLCLFNEEDDEKEDETPTENVQQPQMTILHQILPYHPPVELVDLICKAITRIGSITVPEDLVDARGASPLHIAAAQMCDASIIRRLLQGPTLHLPAVTLDHSKRTALHWVCAAPWSQPNNHNPILTAGSLFWGAAASTTPARDKFLENKLEIIKLLLAAYPYAKVIRDEDHRLPRDLARSLHAEPILVRALSPTEDELECCTGLLQTISLELENGVCDVSRGFEIYADPETDIEELSFHGDDDEDVVEPSPTTSPSSLLLQIDDPLKLSVPMELERVREKIHTGLRTSMLQRRDDSTLHHLNKYSPSA